MELIINNIKKQFKYKENTAEGSFKIQHESSIANFIPFKTKCQKIVIEDILGSLGRNIINKKIDKEEYQEEKIIENIIKKINGITPEKENYIKVFFKELFFKDGNLQLTHPKILFYLKDSDENQSNIAQFLKDIFLDENLKEKFENIYQSKNQLDTLNNILIDSLGTLIENKKNKKYYDMVKYITNKIKEDLLFLLENETLFIEEFKNFIKFYFFMYIGLMSLELRRQLNNDSPDFKGFYFILKWEKASKKRCNYNDGWNRYTKVTVPLLTHRTLLEILNHNNLNRSPMTYKDIYDYTNNLSDENKKIFANSLAKTREWYNNSLEFNARKPNINFNIENIQENIELFYTQIEYQFMKKHSSRYKAHDDFSKNIIEYGKNLYTKKGGNLGLILSLDENIIILLTKLSIGNKEEIRLNELYQKFEDRGVFLDRDSRDALRKYYEKLNILDKKSDSGDAIYVKHIL